MQRNLTKDSIAGLQKRFAKVQKTALDKTIEYFIQHKFIDRELNCLIDDEGLVIDLFYKVFNANVEKERIEPDNLHVTNYI